MISSKYITKITAIIMAMAVLLTCAAMFLHKSDISASAAVEKEYVSKIFDKSGVLDINIEIAQEDWDWLIENALKEEYRSCNITVNGVTYNYVGIRPKGNSSLTQVYRDENTDRFSFKISFGKYVKGQTLCGLSYLALNNVIDDTTYMKEYLSYDMMSALGVPSPAYTYANVMLNGKPWGLYLAVEIIDKSFLERYYGMGDYNLYKPEPMEMGGGGEFSKMREMQQNFQDNKNNEQNKNNAERRFEKGRNARDGMPVTGFEGGEPGGAGRGPGGMGAKGGSNLKYIDDNPGSYSVIRDSAVLKTTGDKDFKKVIKMIKALDSGENLEKYLDIDEILRYFAVNTFLVNLDSYSGGMYHNYYLLEENGIFKILPWDFNLSFAGFGMQNAQKAVNFPIDSPTTDSLENAPLIGKLLEVPEYRELYHKYLQQIVTDYVGNDKFEQNVEKLDALIGNYVKNDATAFYTYEQYQAALPVLTQFVKDRTASVKAQLSGEQPSDSYGSISTTVNLQILGGMGGMGGMGGGGRPGENNEQGGPAGITMPDLEVMGKAMDILMAANGGKITEEHILQLKALGLDDRQIEEIENMAARGPQGPIDGQIPAMRGDQERDRLNDNTNGNKQNPTGAKSSQDIQSTYVILYLVFLTGGIVFVWKFKRKKNI